MSTRYQFYDPSGMFSQSPLTSDSERVKYIPDFTLNKAEVKDIKTDLSLEIKTDIEKAKTIDTDSQ